MTLRPTVLLLPTLLLFACESPEDPVDTDTSDEVTGSPEARLVTESVALGTVCDATEADVVVANDGDAALELIEVTVSGGDWSLVGEAPATIAAGAEATLTVSGSDGEGTLSITTDDPEASTLDVPLSAAANVAPTLSVDAHDPVVPPAGAATLTATVTDEAADEVTVDWSSSEDGLLASDTVADGGDTLAWDGASASPGGHTVTVTATDTCGATATATTSLCQDEGYTEASLDLEDWVFNGQARWDADNGWVELTDTRRYISGTAFQTSQEVDSTNVSISFRFYVSGGSGADGMSLTAIDTTRMTSYVGEVGGGNGYGGLPGWSVEIDTWHNAEYDEPTTEDHVTFVLDGASRTVGEMSAALPDMEDGAWHTMQVDVQGKQVTVTIDGTVYLDDAVAGLTSFPAHVGFTAATGNITNNHLVDALEVQRSVCE